MTPLTPDLEGIKQRCEKVEKLRDGREFDYEQALSQSQEDVPDLLAHIESQVRRVEEVERERDELKLWYQEFGKALEAEKESTKSLRSQLSTAQEAIRVKDEQRYKAQQAVKRVLITYRRQLQGDWYEFVAGEVGLELDEIGFIKEPVKPNHISSSSEVPDSTKRVKELESVLLRFKTLYPNSPHIIKIVDDAIPQQNLNVKG